MRSLDPSSIGGSPRGLSLGSPSLKCSSPPLPSLSCLFLLVWTSSYSERSTWVPHLRSHVSFSVCLLVNVVFLRQALTMWSRLVWNLWQSCLSFLSAGIAGMLWAQVGFLACGAVCMLGPSPLSHISSPTWISDSQAQRFE